MKPQGCVVSHLMNNSYRWLKLPFNAKAGRFGDNKVASKHFLELRKITSGVAGVPEDKASYTVGPWLTFDPQTERFTGEKADAANALLKDQITKGLKFLT